MEAADPARGSGDLRCLFYAEFDNTEGPVLPFQSPPGFLTEEMFDLCSQYVITKPALCNQPLGFTAFGLRFVCFPVLIEDPRYDRNALFFTVGAVVPMGADAEAWASLPRKLAAQLRELEAGSGFLLDPARKAVLSGVLESARLELAARAECSVAIEAHVMLHLRLTPRAAGGAVSGAEVPEVADHQVPVPLRELIPRRGAGDDLALARVAPWIDGIRHVRKLAAAAGVSAKVARSVVQGLLAEGSVAMVDIFQFSSCYSTTRQLGKLFDDGALQAEAVAFICELAAVAEEVAEQAAPAALPRWVQLFALFAALQSAVSVESWRQAHLAEIEALGADPRRLVAFGVIHGLLLRVHRYPLRIARSKPGSKGSITAVSPFAGADAGVNWLELLDGKHSYDELCCTLACSAEELDAALLALQGQPVEQAATMSR